jgi:hypothetical protein
MALGLALASGLPLASHAAEPPARVGRGGSVEVAGREVHCANIVTRLDRRLPNLGAASPEARLMILNPTLLGRYSKTVQLFVFHHECGHHHVGQSELGADCWAVGEGVRDGWLDRNGLAQVCRSFNNAPETDTHPSGQRRCTNLDRCFAKAELEQAKVAAAKSPATQTVAVKAAAVTAPAPRLVAGPRLVRSSVIR